MRDRVWLWIVVSSLAGAACSFGGGGGSGDKPDAAPDAAPPPCPFSYMDVCVNLDLATPLTIDASKTIDTATDAACATPPMVKADSPYCVLAGSSITISAGVTLRAVGTRPLVLAASGDITIAGIVDVSSTRADSTTSTPEVLGAGALVGAAACPDFMSDSVSLAEGGGGGAGGSFGAVGGGGGDGNHDSSSLRGYGGKAAVSIAMPTMALRAGCRGQRGGGNAPTATNGGAPGAPGGILYLATKRAILLTGGQLGANGAGGLGGAAQAGGGGGGSGGLIVLEAMGVTRTNSKIAANGGGGGEGGVLDTGVLIDGAAGQNGSIGTSPAPGGNSTTPPSKGGDGGARSRPTGEDGGFSDESGGGAGGSVGYIHILGATSAANSQESPTVVVN
jgi:hypothetical protein